jgi:DNA polymerase-3 subunit gamma/tau
VIGHFRDLLLVRSAPEPAQVVDMPADRHARVGAQAAKFTVGELSRILSLLIAAQTDMRWTTSPRLTLELALVRSTIPEADPNPAGMAARVERLERLAGIEGVATVSNGPEAGGLAPAVSPPDSPERSVTKPSRSRRGTEGADSEGTGGVAEAGVGWGLAGRSDDARPGGSDGADAPESDAAPHAPAASALDLQAIRRAWPQLLERLLERRQMILRANLESVTATSYDGEVLELAFPPGRKFAVEKVRAKEEDLRSVLADVFGVSPRIRCVARDDPGGPVIVLEEEAPTDQDEVVARLKAEFGAEVEEG